MVLFLPSTPRSTISVGVGSAVVDGSSIGVGGSSVQATVKLVVTSINADRGGNLKANHHKSSENCVVNHL